MSARKITVQLSPDDPSAEFADFTKPELLELIQTLGTAHNLLPNDGPHKPFSPDDIDMDDAVESPWRLEIDAPAGVATIFFDHPGFGPLSFMISAETANEMMQSLSLFLETPPSDSKFN